jgi:hypothetical protein
MLGGAGRNRFQNFDRACPQPASTIKSELTAFRVWNICSITFSLPANSSSGPPVCRLLKGFKSSIVATLKRPDPHRVCWPLSLGIDR